MRPREVNEFLGSGRAGFLTMQLVCQEEPYTRSRTCDQERALTHHYGANRHFERSNLVHMHRACTQERPPGLKHGAMCQSGAGQPYLASARPGCTPHRYTRRRNRTHEHMMAKPASAPPRTFQDLIFALQTYWSEQGCIILAALRHGDGRGHVSYGHVSARRRPGAVECRLRTTFAPAHRRTLWQQSVSPAALLSISGVHQTLAG